MLSSRAAPFKEFGLVADRPQPELFAGFPRYSTRHIPLSSRFRCLVGLVRYLVGFARGSGIGGRRIGADEASAGRSSLSASCCPASWQTARKRAGPSGIRTAMEAINGNFFVKWNILVASVEVKKNLMVSMRLSLI
jgi:hypothetical protein